MRIALLFWCIITICTTHAQTTVSTETLTNQTVIQLHKAGLGSEVIKTKVQSSTCKFDLSTDGLIGLKKAGVPDDIISTMLSIGSNSSANNRVVVTNEPSLPVGEGIYYLDSIRNSYTELAPSILTNQKSGGVGEFFKRSVSGLFNAKQRATLSGEKASTIITHRSVRFLFLFDTTHRGFSNSTSWGAVQSAGEFFLVKMKVAKNTREIVVGKENSITSNIGIDDAVKVPFTSKKIKNGIYEVSFPKSLLPGEYCFMFAASSMYAGTSHKVYDFSIQ